ncbi:MAG: 30S ribosomal protein S8 [Nitrospirales bacterium]|nr:30S ribosomal protein S8 [Nitrospirales bacterium]
MSMTDPLADLFTRIQNAGKRGHETVTLPASNMKSAVLKIFKSEGFIQDYERTVADSKHAVIKIELRYLPGRKKKPMITGIRRISKPGCRAYVGKNDIPRVMGGLGVTFLSTSRGVMTDQQCREHGVGGEVLGCIW